MLGFQGLEVENVFVNDILYLLLCCFSVTLEDLLLQNYAIRKNNQEELNNFEGGREEKGVENPTHHRRCLFERKKRVNM